MNKILITIIGLFLYFSGLDAMRIVPFIHSFDPMSNEIVVQYYLTNNSSETVAFEVAVYRRKQDEKGNDILVPDEDSFIVFPSQVIIPANGSRTIKVKWVGNEEFKANPMKEQAFRVVFSQFHIDMNKKKAKKQGASLEVRLEIVASLYMTPKNASSDIKVISVMEGKDSCEVRVKNAGTKRALTGSITNKITIYNHNVETNGVLSKPDREGVVMAGEERLFVIPRKNVDLYQKKVKQNVKGRGRVAN